MITMKRILIFVLLGSCCFAFAAPAAAHGAHPSASVEDGRAYQQAANNSTTSLENSSLSRSLDPYATIQNYRFQDGTLLIRVQLDRQTDIFATEVRPGQNGTSNVAVDRWRFLDAGIHTLRFDAVSNGTVTATVYSGRGIRNHQNAVQISAGSKQSVSNPIYRRVDLVVVGITVALTFTIAAIWQVLRARLGLGSGGERVA